MLSDVGLLQKLTFRLGTARHAHELHDQLKTHARKTKDLSRRIRWLEAEVERLKNPPPPAIGVGDLVWVFGSGRSGTSWLAEMLSEALEAPTWFEPRLGDVFAADLPTRFRNGAYVMARRHKATWLPSVRNFVLDGARGQFGDELELGGRLVIKETSGCVGAPIISEALPESRLTVIVRDPRDVVASWLDARREGGWRRNQVRGKLDDEPDLLAVHLVERYRRNVENAVSAFDSHRGPKAQIRYEDLRYDAAGVLAGVFSDLGLGGERSEAAAERHSWESIPEEGKGPGKFHRKAKPGGWREDLTPEQVRAVEEVAGPLMDRLGYERET